MVKKPKVTAGQIAIHKAVAAAAKHLSKLPADIRSQMLKVPLKHMNYMSKIFHQKVKLPHQKQNLANWVNRPVFKC